MINDKYPGLLQLLSCYFHQDWSDEFDSPSMAVDAFVKSEAVESVKAARLEIESILSSKYSENEVSNLLRELGCYYEPLVDYASIKKWLEDILERLSSK